MSVHTTTMPEPTLPDQTDTAGLAMDRAIATLLREHRQLGSVLLALQKTIDDVVERNVPPDFGLLASMLYYIDVFPERFHHPKENHHLFHRLRLRCPPAGYLIDRLTSEHARGEWLLLGLYRFLVALQADAPGGARHFRDAVAAYNHFHFSHMRTEELEVLPLAQRYLLEEDWQAIARAFEFDEDPAFGRDAQARFARMRQQIELQSPSKMRRALRRQTDEAA